ncbi:hypothetical protein GGR58DRAFT_402325 [Xylaria digitata]|nr:hypothetical protein GGR58DRAFT_402325 [Xylaria digitata]
MRICGARCILLTVSVRLLLHHMLSVRKKRLFTVTTALESQIGRARQEGAAPLEIIFQFIRTPRGTKVTRPSETTDPRKPPHCDLSRPGISLLRFPRNWGSG